MTDHANEIRTTVYEVNMIDSRGLPMYKETRNPAVSRTALKKKTIANVYKDLPQKHRDALTSDKQPGDHATP